MNLPTKLTLLRIILIPAFVAVFFIRQIPYNYVISAGIFVLAAFTDFLDGKIARKYNLVTDLGKFLDPIADKVLVSTALIVLLVPPAGAGILPNAFYPAVLVAVIMAMPGRNDVTVPSCCTIATISSDEDHASFWCVASCGFTIASNLAEEAFAIVSCFCLITTCVTGIVVS